MLGNAPRGKARCKCINSSRYGAGCATSGISAAISAVISEPPNAPGAATKLEAM